MIRIAFPIDSLQEDWDDDIGNGRSHSDYIVVQIGVPSLKTVSAFAHCLLCLDQKAVHIWIVREFADKRTYSATWNEGLAVIEPLQSHCDLLMDLFCFDSVRFLAGIIFVLLCYV